MREMGEREENKEKETQKRLKCVLREIYFLSNKKGKKARWGIRLIFGGEDVSGMGGNEQKMKRKKKMKNERD